MHQTRGTRTDIHRPSAIDPVDYQFVEFEYTPEDREPFSAPALIARRHFIRQHMERTGGDYSSHAHGGNCHICGAATLYTALFHHRPTNVYIRTGLECANKLDASIDGEEFRRQTQDALKAHAPRLRPRVSLAPGSYGKMRSAPGKKPARRKAPRLISSASLCATALSAKHKEIIFGA